MPVGYTPIYRIFKNGDDITNHFNDRTTEIVVDLTIGQGQADRFSIILDDRDFAIASPALGEPLEIYLGYQEVGLAFMGGFYINEIDYLGPPKQIMITGNSAGFSTNLKTQLIKSYNGKTLSEIVGELAGKAGLPFEIDPSLANKKLPFKNQQGVSGWHLLHEFEQLFGVNVRNENGKITVKPRDKSADASGNLMPWLILRPEDFGTWRVTHSIRSGYSKVRVPYWDKQNHETKWVEQATGNHEDGDNPYRVNRKFNSQAEAQAYAAAKVAVLNRSMGDAQVTLAKGDPWIKPEMTMLIEQMRDGVNGIYTIDNIQHKYTKAEGITTDISARPTTYDYNTSDLQNGEYSPLEGRTPSSGTSQGLSSTGSTTATGQPSGGSNTGTGAQTGGSTGSSGSQSTSTTQ